MSITADIRKGFYGALAKPFGAPSSLFGGGGSGVAVGHSTTPFVTAYPWNNSVGFGTKVANPGTLPGGQVNGALYSPDSTILILAHNGGSFVSAYNWTSAGFGTKLADPAVVPNGACSSVTIRRNPASTFDHVIMSDNDGGAAVFINAYRFVKTVGSQAWGTKFTNPAVLPVGGPSATGKAARFDRTGSKIAMAHGTTPFLTMWPWSDSGFGTKFANPAVLPPNGCSGVTFSKLNGAVATGHGNLTPEHLAVYAISASGFGTKYSIANYPAPAFPDNAQDLEFSDTTIVTANTLSAVYDQYLGWRWDDSDGFGSRHPQLTRIPSAINSVFFNPAQSTIFGTMSAATQIMARRYTVNGYGSLYANPGTLPVGSTRVICVAS